MSIAKVLTKGQIVIPKEIRERVNIRPGDRVEITATEKHVMILPVRTTYTETFKGAVKGKLSLKELAKLYAEKP
jgi:AbrB family looped-hinge helix DNA binding protein